MSINLLLTYNKFVYWNFQQPKSTNYTHTAQLAGLSHSHPIWCGPTKWQLNMTHCRFDFYSNGWMCVCVCVVDWLAASLFGLFNRSTAMDIYSICIQLAFACENLLHINTPRTHTLFTVSLTAFFSYLFPLSVALFSHLFGIQKLLSLCLSLTFFCSIPFAQTMNERNGRNVEYENE